MGGSRVTDYYWGKDGDMLILSGAFEWRDGSPSAVKYAGSVRVRDASPCCPAPTLQSLPVGFVPARAIDVEVAHLLDDWPLEIVAPAFATAVYLPAGDSPTGQHYQAVAHAMGLARRVLPEAEEVDWRPPEGTGEDHYAR
jgi:hypothetical protein